MGAPLRKSWHLTPSRKAKNHNCGKADEEGSTSKQMALLPPHYLRITIYQCRTILRAAPSASQCRFYHSYEHNLLPPFNEAENAILSASLAHVPSVGFTTTALSRGAKDAGYLNVSTNLFTNGPFDLINYHLTVQRLALKNRVQFPDEKLGVGAKVRLLALQRLRANEFIIARWPEVIYICDHPHFPSFTPDSPLAVEALNTVVCRP